MQFQRVAIESIGYSLPEDCVSSLELEHRLAPLYERLKLPEGRLELMSGIQQRRFWATSALPSENSIRSGKLAIEASGVSPTDIGCMIHASVCRDHLEPATACRVHHELGLPSSCMIYDISNACLGMLNGMLQVANMIELGQIQAGLVVGCESGRSLVETTIDTLNQDESLTRKQIKTAVASLTIGSASSAVLLVNASRSQHGTALHSVVSGNATQHHTLCQSGRDEAVGEGMKPLMATDSEALLHEGVAAAQATYAALQREMPDSRVLTKTVCHQVGSAHRAALLDRLALDPDHDFVTFPWLGNTGSSALPVTLAVAAQQSHFEPGDEVGLLGIGSGINVVMMAARWQDVAVKGEGKVGILADATKPTSA